MRTCILVGLAFLTALTSATVTQAGLITITLNSTSSNMQVGNGDSFQSDVAVNSNTAIDGLDYSVTATLGQTTSTTTSNFSAPNASTTILQQTMQQEFNPFVGVIDADGTWSINFTATADFLSYALEGSYETTGSAGLTVLFARLDDVTVGQSLFGNDQQSSNTAHESLVLGEVAGNRFNLLSGNLSGALTNGHSYRMLMVAKAHDNWVDGELAGSGDFRLTISQASPTSPVPEPATLTLLGMGLVSLGGYAARRRKQMASAA